VNVPPKKYVLVQEERLLAFVTTCFEKAGLESSHAHLISRLLVNNDLRGVRSHGTRTAHGYSMDFVNGNLNPRPNVRTLKESGVSTVIDGGGTLGYLPMVRAAESAVLRAKESSVGLALVPHIGHYGSAGHYTRICAEGGCIGFSSQAGRNESKGNPPISFAIPGGAEPDLVLDGGSDLFGPYQGPEYDDLHTRIPAVFFKNLGFMAVSSLLGGGLTGFTLPEGDAIQERWSSARLGGMVLAINIEAAVPGEIFRAEVDRYTRDLLATCEPIPGTDRLLLPGHIEEERTALHRCEGIRFGEQEQLAMTALHEYFDVALPWE
jgi:LDH2 family malate/lactate/ureidoglycolate dehydrogenase